MNHTTTSPTELELRRGADKGFTLVEILIAIVLVGILSAVAVVGISNLVSKGTTSACNASADSARAATAVYFAANGSYPTSITQLTTASGSVPAPLTLPSGVTINTSATTGPTPPAAAVGMQASSGTSWYLTMAAGSGGAAPTFNCYP